MPNGSGVSAWEGGRSSGSPTWCPTSEKLAKGCRLWVRMVRKGIRVQVLQGIVSRSIGILGGSCSGLALRMLFGCSATMSHDTVKQHRGVSKDQKAQAEFPSFMIFMIFMRHCS